ncbi:sulfonate biosynthesis enzyme [Colletotrichum sojae]|uniref:Sulfonate biosynthesis enzyme n=1 Tax=Colletotrichum sojae TaxID=2175907 RepID=A0A8H6J1E1_9PEZI|nr:sulfonate biosynthesis enzyme [Colletotrichum sojae]
MSSRVASRIAPRTAAFRLLRPAPVPAPLAASAVSWPLTSSPASRLPLSSPAGGDQPQPKAMVEDENGFGFIRRNTRDPKPRKKSVTEIRGPYYSVMGKRYLQDVLETMGHYVDGLKFAGGSFSLFPEKLKELIDLAHQHDVYVSTGGWVEHVLTHASASTGFLSLPADDWLRLVERVQAAGLSAKPEIGVQFGAGGDTAAANLSALGSQWTDPSRVMIESEGITKNVESWRTDVVQRVLRDLPMEKVMFEAADPAVFNWYVREIGTDVNLFVDHSQIVQWSALRAGIRGMAATFGKVASFR